MYTPNELLSRLLPRLDKRVNDNLASLRGAASHSDRTLDDVAFRSGKLEEAMELRQLIKNLLQSWEDDDD